LTQLSAQDRALLRDTSVHAAALYNMALYELRQQWFASRDAKQRETGKETAYGDLISPYTLYHKPKRLIISHLHHYVVRFWLRIETKLRCLSVTVFFFIFIKISVGQM
jgi:hypothetical protein